MADRMRVVDGKPWLNDWELFSGTTEELLDRVADLINSHVAHLVVTPNTHHVQLLRTDERLQHAYSRASLRLIDGMPIVWLSRLVGIKHVQRHSGADFLLSAAEAASHKGWRIALMGGDIGVAKEACEILVERFPGLKADSIEVPMIDSVPSSEDDLIIERLAEFAPDLVFVLLGAPKQCYWIDYWLDQLPPAVYVGAGASADYITGRYRRAPRWMQRVGLEWAWRLMHEPRRLASRYLLAAISLLRLSVTSRRRDRSMDAVDGEIARDTTRDEHHVRTGTGR